MTSPSSPQNWVTLREELFAVQAELAQLQAALESSRTIGIAIGIVCERYQIAPEAAFAYLARASQAENRKLREIAEKLITTGEIAVDPTP